VLVTLDLSGQTARRLVETLRPVLRAAPGM